MSPVEVELILSKVSEVKEVVAEDLDLVADIEEDPDEEKEKVYIDILNYFACPLYLHLNLSPLVL